MFRVTILMVTWFPTLICRRYQYVMYIHIHILVSSLLCQSMEISSFLIKSSLMSRSLI